MKHLQNDHVDPPNQNNNNHKLSKLGQHQHVPMEGKPFRTTTNTRVRRKKYIQYITITIRDPSGKVKLLSKVILDTKIITEFTRFISFTRKGEPVL